MLVEKLSLKKKRVMMYFIESTQELIMKDGIESLSIKKIADKAGYNTATLYNYFENLEVLILYASVSNIKNYLQDLKNDISPNMRAIDVYCAIYKNFINHSFENPEIFHILFFGKYSHKLKDIIKKYYEIFPNELDGQIDITRAMLLEGEIHNRDLPVIKKMIEEKSMDKERASYIMETIVRVHQSYLEDILRNKNKLPLNEYKEDFFKIFYFLLEIGKND